MFEGMRKHAPWIIIVIAAVFIISMTIRGVTSIFIEKEYVGIIGGKKITPQEYSDILEQTFANHYQANPEQEIDDATAKRLNDQTWDQLVQQILFDRELKKRGIKVRDQDIVEKLKNPGEDVREIEQLQTDGKFDYNKYESILMDNAEFANWMEMRIRSTLPYEKLYEHVKAEVTVTEEEVRQQYIDENDKASARIIFFDPKKMTYTVTDEDMQEYYEDHKEDYKRGPSRKFKYVNIPLEPSEEDKALAKTRIDSIYNYITENKIDFAEAARELSEGPSADKGGDLGYFTKERMVPEFSEAAFNLEIGKISEPVLSQFGWHIIKVFDKNTNSEGQEQVKASHILINTEASEKTKENHIIRANDLYEQAKEEGLEKIAKDLAYQVRETREFEEDAKFIPGIGSQEEMVKFAFSHDVGDVAEPIKGRGDDFIIAEISYKVGDHYLDYESQKNTIRRKVKEEKTTQLAIEKGKEFYQQHDPAEFFAAAEKDEELQIIEAEEITIDKTITGLRKSEILNETILAHKKDEYTELIKDSNGAYIAHITARTEPDMEKFEAQKEQLITKEQEKAENEHLNEWYRDLKESAEIVDNRKDYYSL